MEFSGPFERRRPFRAEGCSFRLMLLPGRDDIEYYDGATERQDT